MIFFYIIKFAILIGQSTIRGLKFCDTLVKISCVTGTVSPVARMMVLCGNKMSIMHAIKANYAQIKFGAEHSKFCASQIIYGIPNYLWHPKLFMASQII